MSDENPELLALLAIEWFKAGHRAVRMALEIAPSRFERERAQFAYSFQRVAAVLAGHGIRMHEFLDQPYSPSLPVEPVNPEDFTTEEGLIVRETIEPTVLHNGRVVMRGKVVLAKGK